MTNPTQHGQVPAIQRYSIGYHSDEWGVRSSTLGGIPDPSGQWVRYEDHAAALLRLHAYCQELEAQVIRDCMSTQQPAPAPMSPTNRLVAYSAATRLRELGFEWDATAEAWLQPAPATQQAREVVPLDVALYAVEYLGIHNSASRETEMVQMLRKAAQPSPTPQAAQLEFTKEWCMAAAKAEEESGADISAGVPVSPQAAQQAPAEVRRSDLVPGVMHCAKCKFQLNRVTLCVSDGNAYAGDNKTEPCPNGCGPLWPVTWEQEARNCWKTLEEMHERLQAAQQAPAGATPECLTCSDHGAVGNILTAEPCPDCTRWNTQPAPTTQQAPQQPCPTCAALARTVMLDQVSFDRKPDCYGIRQITEDEGVEEWEDIRTSPDVAREEANDMMATGRGELYEVVPLWTTPQPSPTPQAAESVLEDAARLDWLLLRISGAEFRRIGVHYSGNARRADVDAARKQGGA